jgi:hypothetical protein
VALLAEYRSLEKMKPAVSARERPAKHITDNRVKVLKIIILGVTVMVSIKKNRKSFSVIIEGAWSGSISLILQHITLCYKLETIKLAKGLMLTARLRTSQLY